MALAARVRTVWLGHCKTAKSPALLLRLKLLRLLGPFFLGVLVSGKRLTVGRLSAADVDAYDALALKYGCVFDSIKWTGLFGGGIRRYGIYDGGAVLRGGFCLYEGRRFGLRVLLNPAFTPQVGPFFEGRATNSAARTNEQRAVVEAMAEFLGSSGVAVISLGLSQDVNDCLPFYWRGFKVVPHYTYRIDLRQNQDELLAAMSVDRRKGIRKAQKDDITVDAVSETNELRSLVLETFARKDKAFPRDAMHAILGSYPPGINSSCFISRSQGRPVAGVFVVHDTRTAYYLMGGYSSDNAHHGAGALAMYHAILKAKAQGLEVFDFEGSVIPPIEKYFRGFGGQLTPIFGIHKAWLPLEMGLKLVRRQLF